MPAILRDRKIRTTRQPKRLPNHQPSSLTVQSQPPRLQSVAAPQVTLPLLTEPSVEKVRQEEEVELIEEVLQIAQEANQEQITVLGPVNSVSIMLSNERR